MAGVTQKNSAQVYERDVDPIAAVQPLVAIGLIDDVYWEDSTNRYLRGFVLLDTDMQFGTGMSMLTYHHQPLKAAKKSPNFEMSKYQRGKYVRVTFEVFDSYEEAKNGVASPYAGHPCIATVASE